MSFLWINFVNILLGGLHEHFLPGNVNCIFTRKLIEYTIASDYNEVMIVFYFEGSDVWISYHYIWITFVLFYLRLDIANCSGN